MVRTQRPRSARFDAPPPLTTAPTPHARASQWSTVCVYRWPSAWTGCLTAAARFGSDELAAAAGRRDPSRPC